MEGERAPGAAGVVSSEPESSGPQPFTPRERRDLQARHTALQTDAVARGAGGVVMLLVGAAISIGLAVYLINRSKKDYTTTTPSMARP